MKIIATSFFFTAFLAFAVGEPTKNLSTEGPALSVVSHEDRDFFEGRDASEFDAPGYDAEAYGMDDRELLEDEDAMNIEPGESQRELAGYYGGGGYRSGGRSNYRGGGGGYRGGRSNYRGGGGGYRSFGMGMGSMGMGGGSYFRGGGGFRSFGMGSMGMGGGNYHRGGGQGGYRSYGMGMGGW